MAYLTNNLINNIIKRISYSFLRSSSFTPSDSIIANREHASVIESRGQYSAKEDILLNDIKTASTSNILLKIVSNHYQILNQKHTTQSLRSLFELVKKDGLQTPSNVIHHPSFEQLCSRLKKHSREMDLNDIIDILKMLSFLGVPGNSTIFQYLLQLIRHNINDLNLSQVIFLDFVLNKTQHTHLTEALKLALPLVFQLQIGNQMDHENVQQLVDLLTYASKNNIPEKYMNNIVTCLLLHQNIDIQLTKYIVLSLSKSRIAWNDNHKSFKMLLYNSLNHIAENINEFSYAEIIKILNAVKDNVIYKKECFYHEKFLNSCSFYAVTNNIKFEGGIQISRLLSRMGHTHLQLLDYLSELVVLEPDYILNATPFMIFNYVHALSNANYKPQDWDQIKNLILRNPINWHKKNDLPWIKFAMELASLDCYSDSILNKVFYNDFIVDYLARGENILNYLQLLNLYQAVMMFNKSYSGNLPPSNIINTAIEKTCKRTPDPMMKAALELALGGSQYVASGVVMPNGIFVDFLIHFREGNYPIAHSCNTKGDQAIKFEDLNIKKFDNVVCVLNFNKTSYSVNHHRLRGSFDLTVRILAETGCNVVPLSLANWMALPGPEKIPFLMREINLKHTDNTNEEINNEIV